MKKISIIIITLLLLVLTFSACSQVKDNGNGTDAPDDPQTTTQNNEIIGSYTPETNTPETNTPETTHPETTPPETTPPESNIPEKKKSYEEIAKEVVAGKWGNGPERKANLEAAGYDYDPIQHLVNYMLKPEEFLVNEPKTKFEIGEYMDFLIDYFNKPYKSGDDISNVLLPTLCMQTLFKARGSVDLTQFNPDVYQELELKGSDFRTIAPLLLDGEIDFNIYLTDKYKNTHPYTKVTTYTYGRTVYHPDKDLYTTSLGFDGSWGNQNGAVNPNVPLQVTETDSTITVVANIGGTDGYQFDDTVTKTLEYTFNKVVYQDFTFYQLVEVKEATPTANTPAN